MTKKLSIATALIMGMAIVIPALAQTTTTTTAPATTPAPSAIPSQMLLQVGPAGRVTLRGTIDSVSTGSIAVKSWGGDWTVNVSSSAQVLPAAASSDISKFKAGDFVGVQGTVSQSANWTIDATLVRDWTYRQEVNQERKQNEQSIRQTMQSGTPRNYQGTASNMSGTTFTLTAANGTAYTVNVAADAKVVNKNYLTLTLSSIQNGDTVRVWGANANGTITAEVVRDVSIPAAQPKPSNQ